MIEAIFYALLDLPGAVLAHILQKKSALPERNAQTIAAMVFLAVILLACFLAWFVHASTSQLLGLFKK